mgnify:CR=1 FL=1
MDFTLTFIKIFFVTMGMALPLLASMAIMVILMGAIAGRREGWTFFDATYWAFITATTVGFGDIRPMNKLSRFLAVMIAFVGLVFTGIMVSIAVASTTYAFEKHTDIKQIKEVLEAID